MSQQSDASIPPTNPTRRSMRVRRAARSRSLIRVRCKCGSQEEKGDMIECKQCKEWQHKSCITLANSVDTATYKCEVCEAAIRQQNGPATRRSMKQKNVPKTSFDSRAHVYDIDHFAKFVAEKAKNISSPVILLHFFKEYKEISGYQGDPTTIQHNSRKKLSAEIHRMSQFDTDTKAKMLFVMSARVDDEFLKKLRSLANVEVDEWQRITSYKSKNVHFAGKPVANSKPPAQNPVKKARSAARKRKLSVSPPPSERPVSHDEEKDSSSGEEELEVIYSSHRQRSAPINQQPMISFPDSPTHFTQSRVVQPMNSPFSTYNYNNAFFAGPQYTGNNEMNVMNNMMTSFAGFMNTQANFMRDFMTQNETPSQGRVTQSGRSSQDTTSLKEFLKYIQTYITRINSLQLSEVYHQIQGRLTNMGHFDEKIPMNRLRLALEALLALCDSTSMSFGINSMESTNSKDFFKFLQFYVNSLDNQHLFGLNEQLHQKIGSIGEDQQIRLDKLRMAFEAAVAIILQ